MVRKGSRVQVSVTAPIAHNSIAELWAIDTCIISVKLLIYTLNFIRGTKIYGKENAQAKNHWSGLRKLRPAPSLYCQEHAKYS